MSQDELGSEIRLWEVPLCKCIQGKYWRWSDFIKRPRVGDQGEQLESVRVSTDVVWEGRGNTDHNECTWIHF